MTYSKHDMEIQQRLTVVETKLESVADNLQEHRGYSKLRSDELLDLVTKLGVKIDNQKFQWSSLLKNPKVIIALVAGVTAAAKALLP